MERRYRTGRLVLDWTSIALPVLVGFLLIGCDELAGIFSSESSDLLSADASRTAVFSTTDESGRVVRLDASASTAGQDGIVSYRWLLGEILVATGEIAEINLPPGRYQVRLEIQDASGLTSLDTLTVEVSGNLQRTFLLTIEATEGGQTIPSVGTTLQPANETIRLQAVADAGFQFARWTGAIESDVSSIAILMDDDKNFVAQFVPAAGGTQPVFRLPWASERTRNVTQGNDGEFSHRDQFAWDFPMPIGTPVLASAAGRVVDIRDTSPPNVSGTTEFTNPENFVTIDHGGGVQSFYAHLDFRGVTVAPGQWVARGQVVGFACDTGVSTSSHLHYEAIDLTGKSISSRFEEVGDNEGIPREGDSVTSKNQLEHSTLSEYVQSATPSDAFTDNGIELFSPLPPAFFFVSDTDYLVTGRAFGGVSKVCAALVDSDTFETVHCELTDVEADGFFVHPFRFDTRIEGRFFFGVIVGNAEAQGVAPRSVVVSPPVDLRNRPVAVIEQPVDTTVDFRETRPLRDGESLSPVGRSLTYHWMQVSGPPAEIADPDASETEFQLGLGGGIDRVAFQLVVSDGVLHSLPAEVAFFMLDTFFVSSAGVADRVCDSPKLCPEFDTPPPLISFSTGVIVGWAELVGVTEGDALSFSVVDPLGDVVAVNAVTVLSQQPAISFWRFAMSSGDLVLTPGLWTGKLSRNGQTEAEIEFRVLP